jgi:diguanylate cyclase (GGDEF)-like protein
MARIPGERSRRPWYQLEDRHGGILAGRVVAAGALAVAAALAPAALLERHDGPIVVACAAALLAHLLLWALPLRSPRRLRLAVDVSLVVDAAWATAVATAAGGSRSPLTVLYLVTTLWAALGYSARTGVKGGVLATMGFLAMVWADDGRLWSAASLGRIALFWILVASAVAGAAAGERELRRRAERLAILHRAAGTLLSAPDADAMVACARRAARDLMPDWQTDVRLGAAPAEVRLERAEADGLIVVPIRPGERSVGAIEARRALPAGRVVHRVRLRELSALETLAAALGSALWRAELVADIERRSLTDALTGLGNRRAFDEELERRLADARRRGGGVALCLLDIDHFKSFNDTYGHRAGDEALAAVARAVRASCRTADVPARYGGEEMAVVMPGIGVREAAIVAERIRAAVAATDAGPRDVTVSVGVAATAGGCSAEVLIEAADRALYAAKQGGRDRVVAAAPEAVA